MTPDAMTPDAMTPDAMTPDASAAAQRRLDDSFRSATQRPAVCAGTSYPRDPAELRALFDALFLNAPPPDPAGALCGILAPHIDLSIGAHAYVAPFTQLRDAAFDICVILGTAHYPAGEELFYTTGKDFVTPFGTAATERRFVRLLQEAAGASAARDDLPFRLEHSVEFPVLFLQYLFGDALRPIVPLLCNSFDHFLSDGRDPAHDASCAAFLRAFRATLQETGLRPMYVVSVDWSHVGRKFGHDVDAGAVLNVIRHSDSEQLSALERCDLPRFRALLSDTENATQIDGYSCLTAFFECAQPRRGTLLSYNLWHEEERGSAVSYAGMAFYSDSGPRQHGGSGDP
jgi:hypothetical protein